MSKESCRASTTGPLRQGASYGSLQIRELLAWDQEAYGTGLPWRSGDQTALLEVQYHLVNRWGRDPEISLHVRLGRRPAVELDVVVDDGEILSLPGREVTFHSEFLPECLVEDGGEKGVKLGGGLGLETN